MTARFERVKNFITAEECAQLNAWVEQGVKKKWLDIGYTSQAQRTDKRVTTRMYGSRFTYPNLVHGIAARISQHWGLSEFGMIQDHGKSGVVVSCTFTGGDVYQHRDPQSEEGLAALRCNILTQAADFGGVLRINGEDKALQVGELHCYLASEHAHEVTTVEGNTPRILWMFGFYVPKSFWEPQ